jgi:hypothetical protein
VASARETNSAQLANSEIRFSSLFLQERGKVGDVIPKGFPKNDHGSGIITGQRLWIGTPASAPA